MPISRRSFVARSAALASAATALDPAWAAPEDSPARQATGTRVGEVTPDGAVVWVRLTANPTRVGGRGGKPATDEPVEKLEGACPGTAGRVRLRYGPREDLAGATVTDWFDVDEAGDFIHHSA